MGNAGDRIRRDNLAATARAGAFMIEHSTAPKDSLIRVITTFPGQYGLLNFPRIRPIVPLFRYLPDSVHSLAETWHRLNAEFVLTDNVDPSIMSDEGDHILPDFVKNSSDMVYSEVGIFSDIGRGYAISDTVRKDTLRIYRLHLK